MLFQVRLPPLPGGETATLWGHAPDRATVELAYPGCRIDRMHQTEIPGTTCNFWLHKFNPLGVVT